MADQGGAKYSKLADVNAKNVTLLHEAWSWKTGETELPQYGSRPGMFEGLRIVQLVDSATPGPGSSQWIHDYRAEADAGYGYPRPTVTGPNPSLHYSEQLKELDAAASAKGGRFAALSHQDKRAIIQSAPVAGRVDLDTAPTTSSAKSRFRQAARGPLLCLIRR